jgi:hypothetical protein
MPLRFITCVIMTSPARRLDLIGQAGACGSQESERADGKSATG